MNRNKVGKFRMNEESEQADITLLNDNTVVMIPRSCVVKQDTNGNDIPLLAPGDRFTILQDDMGYGFAYVYNKHLYMVETPYDARAFIRDIPFMDKIVFAHALRREVMRRKQTPSLMAYKNLQKLIVDRIDTEQRLIKQL
jgi:hypothetical protein